MVATYKHLHLFLWLWSLGEVHGFAAHSSSLLLVRPHQGRWVDVVPPGGRATTTTSPPPKYPIVAAGSSVTSTSVLAATSSQTANDDVLVADSSAKETNKTTTHPPSFFFASVERQESASDGRGRERRRELGSQELFMLPRQYGPKLRQGVVFPQLNHVSVHVLSQTPHLEDLRIALTELARAHPLLRATVDGDGEPDKRIDLFQMVRSGDPSPPTFVVRDDGDNSEFDVDSVLRVVTLPTEPELYKSWREAMRRDLDDASWCHARESGPLWKLELHRVDRNLQAPCAIVLTFNHAISDQSSANRLLDQLLAMVVDLETSGRVGETTAPQAQDLPVSVEDSVLGLGQRWKDVGARGITPGTLKYVASKAAEGFKDPVILPDDNSDASLTGGGSGSGSSPLAVLAIISGQAAGGTDDASDARTSVVEFRTLNAETTKLLVEQCKANGVSVSNAVTAAVTLAATDLVGTANNKRRNYKVLQSLDMRRFGARLDRGETLACMAGSHDLMHGPLPDGSGEAVRRDPAGKADLFWGLAKEGKRQTEAFVGSGGPEQALRVFDFAVTIADLGNLVYLTSQSKDTRGRAYSAGATNVGVYELTQGFAARDGRRHNLKTQHGRFCVQDVFFATPHTQSGCLYPVSCLTVNGELKMTFHPVAPIVNEETNRRFADSFTGLLEAVATGESRAAGSLASTSNKSLASNALSMLPLATTILGIAAVASHGPAWVSFFRSVAEMKANVDNPADFWAALNFWIFFAVGHPILQPILWISDVLHGTPGPKIADLVPALFLAGNAAVIAIIATSKEVRDSVNIALLAAFFAYVGSGLEGTAGLGDFNLALDDSYKGQVVKGCPAYDAVRQPSMDSFDLKKYQGLWYEHKFHDWTQFKEVYDTTLNIKLTDDGQGWVDDFAVKGPAPDAAKLSWDKSPVANGAHYFLFGRVDKNDPPGVLRESGFGVEFPNYIVDVQKDPETGEYTEAIQFQCLERGGVRVFEGINFMSRKDVMTDEQIANMHARAEKAGMYAYGAAPEQMHTVARKLNAEPIDNSWQAMWRAIGFDKLLELLTESIEDGGR